MNIEKKRQKEIEIISLMIDLYYKHRQEELYEYKLLLEYATERIKKCPMMETKTFCSQCQIHCYEKKTQDKIKKVMKYSGPRMILHHPWLAIRHTLHR